MSAFAQKQTDWPDLQVGVHCTKIVWCCIKKGTANASSWPVFSFDKFFKVKGKFSLVIQQSHLARDC